MGGFGSGRREYAETPTVEECRHLDVNELKDALSRVGERGRIWWGEEGNEDTPNISFVVEGDTSETSDADEHDRADEDARATGLRLIYSVRNHRTDETEGYEYVVPVEYTECHFGGVRPWFRCPAQDCGKRVGKLYCPPRGHYYVCRECHNLGYRSSRKSGNALDTAELRYRRAFEKADKDDRRPHPNGEPWFPEKPKGMHQDTFEELVDEVRAAREEWERIRQERLRKLASRAGVDTPLG